MDAEYLTAWLLAFLLSLAVEAPLYVLVSRGRCAWPRAALAGAAGTCLTHPLLWFVWVRLVSDYATYIISGEILVALIETVVFWRLARVDLRTAVAASFLANAASVLVGLALRATF